MASELFIFYNELTHERIMFNSKRTMHALRVFRRMWKRGKYKGKMEDFTCPLIDENLLMLGCYSR